MALKLSRGHTSVNGICQFTRVARTHAQQATLLPPALIIEGIVSCQLVLKTKLLVSE